MSEPSIPTQSGFCPCVVALDDAQTTMAVPLPGEGAQYTFTAAEGLYQLSVVADAREFDWEELYLVLNTQGNVNERTGPWDFSFLDGNRPLVPTYRVTVDGRYLGLWYFQRVSIEDIAAKRFRGRMAFQLENAGEHVLELTPYRPLRIAWLSAVLERDPEDTLEPVTADLSDWLQRCPPAQWADPAYWQDMQQKLATTHAIFAESLQGAFAWMDKRDWFNATDVPFLLAQYYLQDNHAALEKAIRIIDEHVEKEHWGNQAFEGYSQDGDMGAANTFFVLIWAYHALGALLGEERRARMVEKLRLQGERFMTQAMLTRDYWGGSVIQDHGWRALFGFGGGVLYALGVLPEAQRWASYVIPRIRRSLRAMPRDGVIPIYNYCSLYLYLDESLQYRNALLALNGEDAYEQGPFYAVVDYLMQIVRPDEHLMVLEDTIPLIGGNAFLNVAASKNRDGRAAYLQQLVLGTPRTNFYHPTQENAYFYDCFWGLLTYDPTVPPITDPPQPAPLVHFPDSSLVCYHDTIDNVTLTLRCGASPSYHAYRTAAGPCDRMESAPGAGHFAVTLGTAPRLATPEGGYKMLSILRTCLLVDGHGQYGDIGYPMSLPSKQYRGAEITFARWDAQANYGWIRLTLTPAYPEEMGLALYTRDLLLYPGEKIVCRDRVVASQPHQWSWLFQGRNDGSLSLDGLTAIIGNDAPLRVTPHAGDLALHASIAITPVVFSYASASGFKRNQHARYDSLEATTAATVDFVLTWK